MNIFSRVPSWAQNHVDIWRSREHLIGEDESARKPLSNPQDVDTFVSQQAAHFEQQDNFGLDRDPAKGSIDFIKPGAGNPAQVNYTGDFNQGTYVVQSHGIPGTKVEVNTFSQDQMSTLTLVQNVFTGEIDASVKVVDRQDPANSWTNTN